MVVFRLGLELGCAQFCPFLTQLTKNGPLQGVRASNEVESTQESSGKEPQHISKWWWPSTHLSCVLHMTGSLPFCFSPKHCIKLLARGSVIRDTLVHKGQAGMLGNKSGDQKNVYLQFQGTTEPAGAQELRVYWWMEHPGTYAGQTWLVCCALVPDEVCNPGLEE